MSISFLTPARTVLLIGDEALYIYKVAHNSVKMLDSVPWQTDGFEETVVGLIRKEGGGKPVLILNDMTDQHFKGGQRLPKVGLMDKGGVLKRKLMVAFPNYPIRGALPIKDSKAGAKADSVKGGGGLYLFAAVPVSEPIVKTLEAVKLSMAPIAGFALLPVESSDMVRTLSEKLAGGARKASRWTVFIGQHQNGALRQVIARDGQLAMTRMTPVSELDSDPQGWAYEVAQEFKATVSYLSRFGYAADDGTDVIVVGSKEAGDALEKLIEVPCNFYSYTAPEAARMLGMKIGLQEDGRFAESLHVAWAGRKTKFILPMEAEDITKIHKPRQAVAAIVTLLLLGACYLGYQLVAQTQSMIATKDDLASQQRVLTEAEADYQQEVARMDALGFDIELIQGSIKTYESFEKGRVKTLYLLKQIGAALGNELRLDKIEVDKTGGGRIVEVEGVDEVTEATLEAVLYFSFPPTIQPEEGMKEMNNLETRLANALPGYEVRVTKQVATPEYSANLKGEVGEKTKTAQDLTSQEDYFGEITIRGPKS